jgi:hypothetical protein
LFVDEPFSVRRTSARSRKAGYAGVSLFNHRQNVLIVGINARNTAVRA